VCHTVLNTITAAKRMLTCDRRHNRPVGCDVNTSSHNARTSCDTRLQQAGTRPGLDLASARVLRHDLVDDTGTGVHGRGVEDGVPVRAIVSFGGMSPPPQEQRLDVVPMSEVSGRECLADAGRAVTQADVAVASANSANRRCSLVTRNGVGCAGSGSSSPGGSGSRSTASASVSQCSVVGSAAGSLVSSGAGTVSPPDSA
jgi:hypothetical protein